MSRRLPLLVSLAFVAIAPACGEQVAPFECGEGEGEGAVFGPTLEGPAVPAEEGTLPLNGILHVAVRNQGVPVDASLRTGGIDDTERPVDVDEVGPVMRVLVDGLVANTSYTATLQMDPGEAPQGAQIVRDLSFTTTDLTDNTPPVFAGEPTIEVVRSLGGAQCSGDGTLVNIISPDIVDDGGAAGVKMFSLESDGSLTLLTFALGVGSGKILVDTRETGIDADYRIVAVDLAGNESEPLAVDVP